MARPAGAQPSAGEASPGGAQVSDLGRPTFLLGPRRPSHGVGLRRLRRTHVVAGRLPRRNKARGWHGDAIAFLSRQGQQRVCDRVPGGQQGETGCATGRAAGQFNTARTQLLGLGDFASENMSRRGAGECSFSRMGFHDLLGSGGGVCEALGGSSVGCARWPTLDRALPISRTWSCQRTFGATMPLATCRFRCSGEVLRTLVRVRRAGGFRWNTWLCNRSSN